MKEVEYGAQIDLPKEAGLLVVASVGSLSGFADSHVGDTRPASQAARTRFKSSSVRICPARTSASNCVWQVRKKRSIRPPAGGSRGGRCKSWMLSWVQANCRALAW